MSRPKSKTAAEFAAELANDREYQQRRAERQAAAEARGAAVAADEQALVVDLNEIGINASSIYDFVGERTLPAAAVPVLLRHLDLPHIPAVREGIIRALSCSHLRPQALDVLKAAFAKADQTSERWLFANALAAMATLAELQPELTGVGEYAGLFRSRSRE